MSARMYRVGILDGKTLQGSMLLYWWYYEQISPVDFDATRYDFVHSELYSRVVIDYDNWRQLAIEFDTVTFHVVETVENIYGSGRHSVVVDVEIPGAYIDGARIEFLIEEEGLYQFLTGFALSTTGYEWNFELCEVGKSREFWQGEAVEYFISE